MQLKQYFLYLPAIVPVPVDLVLTQTPDRGNTVYSLAK